MMSFANLLFCANLLLCGVNVLSENPDDSFLEFYIRYKYRNVSTEKELSTEFSFEEGLEYTVTCRRINDWNLHLEVEPYGLKSSTYSSIHSANRLDMVFNLNRDDEITIGCFSKNNRNDKEEKRTKFSWDKNETLSRSPNAAKDIGIHPEEKCYQKNNTINKCAYFDGTEVNDNLSSHLISLKMYTQIINDTSSHQDIERSNKYVWVPAIAGVGTVVLVVICVICYIKIIRKRIHNQDIYAEPEPPIVYAEIQMDSDGKLPLTENTPYAQIIGCIAKKNVTKIDKTSEDIRSKTENTRIGIVENLYSEIH